MLILAIILLSVIFLSHVVLMLVLFRVKKNMEKLALSEISHFDKLQLSVDDIRRKISNKG